MRYFTPEEASQMLPLVKRIVDDILDAGRQLRTLAPDGSTERRRVAECERLAGRLDSLFKELESLGCTYKDWSFQVGLVDFPARLGDEEVLLCWRSDESELRYYHGLHDGYAGRKEIPRRSLPRVKE